MVDAYLDNGKVADREVILSICAELGANPVRDFDLIPLYKGFGSKGIGRECSECGAPLGSVDPDDCAWIMLGRCSDCREAA